MVRGRERKEQRTGDSGLEPPACDAVTMDSHTSLCTWCRAAARADVACGIWALTVCSSRLASCDQCALLMEDVCMWDGVGGTGILDVFRSALLWTQTSENSVLKTRNYASCLFLYLTLAVITKVGIFFYSKVFLRCHIIASGLCFLKEYLLVPLREQSEN